MDEMKTLIEKTGLILSKEVDGLEQIFNRYENMVKISLIPSPQKNSQKLLSPES